MFIVGIKYNKIISKIHFVRIYTAYLFTYILDMIFVDELQNK